MSVHKDKNNGTWYVMTRYDDWTGKRKQTCKRGFKTKKEAQKWEMQFSLKQEADLDMTFASFFELYKRDMQLQMKENTWETKENIIRTKVLPYLGKKKMAEITARDIIQWQNVMRKTKTKQGNYLSPTYLRTIHSQLCSVFNHAVKFYNLESNPANKVGSMGEREGREMLFWTKQEYLKFAEAVMDKPISYYAFEMLYWTGIREGELLALTPEDFDFKNNTVRINKSYQRIKKKDVITPPKTRNSIRTIKMPQFLTDEIKDFIDQFYRIDPKDRLFQISKDYLKRELERGCESTGIKVIRVHDLRHSHVSLLIDMGFTALAIGKRVGHSTERITYRYAHLFPTIQNEMAYKLELSRREDIEETQIELKEVV